MYTTRLALVEWDLTGLPISTRHEIYETGDSFTLYLLKLEIKAKGLLAPGQGELLAVYDGGESEEPESPTSHMKTL